MSTGSQFFRIARTLMREVRREASRPATTIGEPTGSTDDPDGASNSAHETGRLKDNSPPSRLRSPNLSVDKTGTAVASQAESPEMVAPRKRARTDATQPAPGGSLDNSAFFSGSQEDSFMDSLVRCCNEAESKRKVDTDDSVPKTGDAVDAGVECPDILLSPTFDGPLCTLPLDHLGKEGEHNPVEGDGEENELEFELRYSGSLDSSRMQAALSAHASASISYWKLPDFVHNAYKAKGISNLYPWQVECLTTTSCVEGKNLVYSAPTSAGKTLVSELLLIRRLVEMQRLCMFVVPYVSMVEEKTVYFTELLEGAGIAVHGLCGNRATIVHEKDQLIICTIEKANSIVNKLLEEKRIHDLGTIVVDELHMLADLDRGYILELMMTKVLFTSNTGEVQVVAMSATMPNLEEMAKWLHADLYVTDYRPVPLENFLVCDAVVSDEQSTELRVLDLPGYTDVASTGKKPIIPLIEQLAGLCAECVSDGHNVLVFCPTKRTCESCAGNLIQRLGRLLNNNQSKVDEKQLDEKRKELVEELERTHMVLDQTLAHCVLNGICYHHAGLTTEERSLIEKAYREGVLRVLCATSTLSTGVNLPARRVVFFQPRVGMSFIDKSRYFQAAGRAGRAGKDTLGESYLLFSAHERAQVAAMIDSEIGAVRSPLSVESRGLERLVLEVIASGVATSNIDLQAFAASTFYGSSCAVSEVQESFSKCADYLLDNGFIASEPLAQSSHVLYKTTPLGEATFAGSLAPADGVAIFAELRRARNNLCLSTDLHLIYEVTPLRTNVTIADWFQYLQLTTRLGPEERHVADLIGIDEGFLTRATQNRPRMDRERVPDIVAKHFRFYASLILHALVRETDTSSVCRTFRVHRGEVQALQSLVAGYCRMTAIFCEKLNWWPLSHLFSQLHERVNFGAQPDILPLLQIPNVKNYRARLLWNNGYRTVADVANAELGSISKVFRSELSSSRNANRLLSSRVDERLAKKIIRSARDALAEQIQALQDGLPAAVGANGPVTVRPRNSQDSCSQVDTFRDSLVHDSPAPVMTGDASTFHLHRFEGSAVDPADIEIIWEKAAQGMLVGLKLHFNSDDVHSRTLDLTAFSVGWNGTEGLYVSLSWVSSLCMSRCTQHLRRFLQFASSAATRIAVFDVKNQLVGLLRFLDGSSVNLSIEYVLTLFKSDRLEDPVVAAMLCRPDRPRGKLTSLRGLYHEVFGHQVRLPRGFGYRDFHALVGCFDCIQTAQLSGYYDEKLELAKLTAVYREIEIPSARWCAYIESWGIGINTLSLEKSILPIQRRIDELASECRAISGMEFSVDNHRLVRRILFHKLKLPLPRGYTEANVSVNKDVLHELSEFHALPRLILETRQLKRLLGYVKSLPTFVQSTTEGSGPSEDYSGRIRAFHVPIGTATGRMTIESPNLQAIPRLWESDDSFSVNVRDAFHARPGFRLVAADFANMEVRILAHLSRDERMCRLLRRSDRDLFDLVAGALLDRQESVPISGAEREQAKRVTYGLIYGIGPRMLARQLHAPEASCRQLIHLFRQRFPGISEFISSLTKQCTEHGYVETIQGRRRPLPDLSSANSSVRSRALRQAVNTVCQGSAADMLKCAVNQLFCSGLVNGESVFLVLHVHDELIFEVADSAAVHVVPKLRQLMEGTAKLCVPMPVRVRVGRTWGSLQAWAE